MIKNLIAVLAVLLVANANAATMWIIAPPDVVVGETFEILIVGDFTGEGLIAGGVTLSWNVALSLDQIQLDLPVLPDFSCPGSDNCPAPAANSTPIVWGEFLNDLISPNDPAPTQMATLTFTALGGFRGQLLDVFFLETNDELTGGWFGAGFVPIDTPVFLSNVPLPAGLWLMFGALGTLLAFRK